MRETDEKRLFRVTSPYYVAGFTARRSGRLWIVDTAAPILGWLAGLELEAVRSWFERRTHTYRFEEITEEG